MRLYLIQKKKIPHQRAVTSQRKHVEWVLTLDRADIHKRLFKDAETNKKSPRPLSKAKRVKFELVLGFGTHGQAL